MVFLPFLPGGNRIREKREAGVGLFEDLPDEDAGEEPEPEDAGEEPEQTQLSPEEAQAQLETAQAGISTGLNLFGATAGAAAAPVTQATNQAVQGWEVVSTDDGAADPTDDEPATDADEDTDSSGTDRLPQLIENETGGVLAVVIGAGAVVAALLWGGS